MYSILSGLGHTSVTGMDFRPPPHLTWIHIQDLKHNKDVRNPPGSSTSIFSGFGWGCCWKITSVLDNLLSGRPNSSWNSLNFSLWSMEIVSENLRFSVTLIGSTVFTTCVVLLTILSVPSSSDEDDGTEIGTDNCNVKVSPVRLQFHTTWGLYGGINKRKNKM